MRLAAIGLLIAVWIPVVTDRDGLPFSTYPMYSSPRTNETTLVTAVVQRGDRLERLSLELIGASDDPLIVAGELRAAIRDGRADERCREIAERIGDGVVEIVSERHDTVARTLGDPSLLDRRVHARCSAR